MHLSVEGNYGLNADSRNEILLKPLLQTRRCLVVTINLEKIPLNVVIFSSALVAAVVNNLLAWILEGRKARLAIDSKRRELDFTIEAKKQELSFNRYAEKRYAHIEEFYSKVLAYRKSILHLSVSINQSLSQEVVLEARRLNVDLEGFVSRNGMYFTPEMHTMSNELTRYARLLFVEPENLTKKNVEPMAIQTFEKSSSLMASLQQAISGN